MGLRSVSLPCWMYDNMEIILKYLLTRIFYYYCYYGVGCSKFDRTLKLFNPNATSTSAGEEHFLRLNLAQCFAAGSRVGQTIWTNALPLRSERENLLEKVKGLEHNRLPLKLIQAHLGEKQLFPRYAKEKATRQASSSYFFILVIFIYF